MFAGAALRKCSGPTLTWASSSGVLKAAGGHTGIGLAAEKTARVSDLLKIARYGHSRAGESEAEENVGCPSPIVESAQWS